jgi:hypothetical protein
VKDAGELFADLTGEIEGLHSLAVDGQAEGLSPDIHEALLSAIKIALRSIHRTVLEIALTLP